MNQQKWPSGDVVADALARLHRQFTELFGRVAAGNVDLDTARRHLQAAILGLPARENTPPHFVPCIQQLKNLELWNDRYHWGFTELDIARAYVEARSFDWPGDKFQAIVLVPSLASVVDTYVALSIILSTEIMALDGLSREVPPVNERPPGWSATYTHVLQEHPERLTLVEGATFRPRSLEWRLVDLGALRHSSYSGNWRAYERVDHKISAHAEVLAAACHFPAWLKAIHSGTAPSVCIPGYRAAGYRFNGRDDGDAISLQRISHYMSLGTNGFVGDDMAIALSYPMNIGTRLG